LLSMRRGPSWGAAASFLAMLVVPAAVSGLGSTAKVRQTEEGEKPPAVLWRDPVDISSRNLFYGSGGREGEPHAPFTFLKEDFHGSNPKFDVVDRDGIKWRVKLGYEARPETAASRLVWAAGYFTAEYYFLPVLRVRNMPTVLQRGQKYIEKDGSISDVRLKRNPGDEKHEGRWSWRHNSFSGTRELNGLRVMMALINNWDLKDDNNAVYRVKDDAGGMEDLYAVSDLGATFGTTGETRSGARSKGNLRSYANSRFLSRIAPDYVDFSSPARPSLPVLVDPVLFVEEMHLRWIGKRIPRADARWIGRLLGRLSRDQIRDAFRAAGYSPEEVEGFATAVIDRIAQLNGL